MGRSGDNIVREIQRVDLAWLNRCSLEMQTLQRSSGWISRFQHYCYKAVLRPRPHRAHPRSHHLPLVCEYARGNEAMSRRGDEATSKSPPVMSQRARSAYPSLSRLRIGANSLTPATMNDLPRELVERIIWCLKSEDTVSDITRLVRARILNRQQFQPVIDRLMLATNQPLSGILLAEPEDGGCAQVIHDLGVLSSPLTSNEPEPQVGS